MVPLGSALVAGKNSPVSGVPSLDSKVMASEIYPASFGLEYAYRVGAKKSVVQPHNSIAAAHIIE